MFLSYENSTFARSFRRKPNREAPVSEQRNSHSGHKSRKSSTSAHLFLDYANDKREKQKSTSSGPQQPRVKIQVQQQEVDDFRCRGNLPPEQGFSAYHASTAANALNKAAEAAASSKSKDNSEDVFSLYRSFIRRAVTAQPESLADCDASMNTSEVFLKHGNRSSSSQSLQSQQDELMFLRLAVKELLFRLPDEDTLVPQENNKNNAIPSNIEFHPPEIMDDDITETASFVSRDAKGEETQECPLMANPPGHEKTPLRIDWLDEKGQQQQSKRI
jgi:hypothetical protein